MKSSIKIIILIVIFAALVLGLTAFLVSYLVNGDSFDFNFSIGSFASKEGELLFSKDYDIEEFKNIKVDYDTGNIFFEEADGNYAKVEIYGDKERDIFNVDKENGDLNISCKIKNSFSLFNVNTERRMVVQIPSSFANEIEIKNDCGNTKLCDLANVKVDINSDAGNVKVGKVYTAKIKCDCGNVDIKELLNKCEINDDCGNIKIEKMDIKEDSYIKSDYGNVTINEINDIYIDAKVDAGNKKIAKNNRKAEVILKIDCDCGNIRVK